MNMPCRGKLTRRVVGHGVAEHRTAIVRRVRHEGRRGAAAPRRRGPQRVCHVCVALVDDCARKTSVERSQPSALTSDSGYLSKGCAWLRACHTGLTAHLLRHIAVINLLVPVVTSLCITRGCHTPDILVSLGLRYTLWRNCIPPAGMSTFSLRPNRYNSSRPAFTLSYWHPGYNMCQYLDGRAQMADCSWTDSRPPMPWRAHRGRWRWASPAARPRRPA